MSALRSDDGMVDEIFVVVARMKFFWLSLKLRARSCTDTDIVPADAIARPATPWVRPATLVKQSLALACEIANRISAKLVEANINNYGSLSGVHIDKRDRSGQYIIQMGIYQKMSGAKKEKVYKKVAIPLVGRFPWLSDSWKANRLRASIYACGVIRTGDAQLATVLCEDSTPSAALLGPPFSSMDGEYHSPIVEMERLQDSVDSIPKALRSKCISAYSEVLGDEELIVTAYARTPELASRVQAAIDDSIPQWILSVFIVGTQLRRSVFPPNAHPASVEIYRDFAETLDEKLTPDERDVMQKMYVALTFERGSEDRLYSTLIGAKIIPLTLGEVANIGSVRYQLWRELFADYLTAKLVFNQLTDAFPMYGQWAVILGGGEEMYSAHVIHERYVKAPIVTEIRKHLQSASTKLTSLGDAGRAASEHVARAITTVDSRLELTDLSLVKTSEHIGFTLAHIILKLDKISEPRKFLLTDPNLYEPLVFAWLYALHVMHTRVGVIHTDLHANNIAVNWRLLIADADENYHVRGDIFRMKYTGIRAHIIDFSRGILGDLKTVQERYGVTAGQDFLAKQTPYVLQLVQRAHPQFLELHREAIQGACMLNFQGVAGVCAVLDAVILAKSLQYAADAVESKSLKELAARIEVAALSLFEKNIREVFSAPMKAPPMKDCHYVADLTGGLFGHFKVEPKAAVLYTNEWKDSSELQIDPEDTSTWTRGMFSWLENPDAALELAKKQAEMHADNSAMVALKEAAAMRNCGTSAKFTASQGSWIV